MAVEISWQLVALAAVVLAFIGLLFWLSFLERKRNPKKQFNPLLLGLLFAVTILFLIFFGEKFVGFPHDGFLAANWWWIFPALSICIFLIYYAYMKKLKPKTPTELFAEAEQNLKRFFNAQPVRGASLRFAKPRFKITEGAFGGSFYNAVANILIATDLGVFVLQKLNAYSMYMVELVINPKREELEASFGKETAKIMDAERAELQRYVDELTERGEERAREEEDIGRKPGEA